MVARVLEMALSRAGHQVHLARDFPTAKARLAEPWDAIVLDLNLPGGLAWTSSGICAKSWARIPR